MDNSPTSPVTPLQYKLHTIFLYTEEKRGSQLVESPVIGMMSDISGSDKLIVVQDPFSGLKIIYRINYESNNLDAVAITEQDESAFNGRNSVTISDMVYKLGTVEKAMQLLRNKNRWIQDKGAILSVLLQNVAIRTIRFAPRGLITRGRLREIPLNAPVEYLSGMSKLTPELEPESESKSESESKL